MKRLAICIDDYGLHPGVNEAAQRLSAMRRISAVSCMVGAPHWAEGVAALRALDDGRLDIGLHLDLTAYPLMAGGPWRLPHLIAKAYARLLDPARIAAEIAEQLLAFEDAMGRPPDHVDGHGHVHQLPVVRDALVMTLWRRFPDWRPWLRSTRRGKQSESLRTLLPRKSWLIEHLGADSLGHVAHRYGYPQNRSLHGVYNFADHSRAYALRLAEWLKRARDGDVLMCHASAPTAMADPILPARLNEFAVLSGAAFDDMLLRAGVRLDVMSRMQRRRNRRTSGRTDEAARTPSN